MAELAAMFVDQLTWNPVVVGVLACTFEIASGAGVPLLLLLPLTTPEQPARPKLKMEMSRRAAREKFWFAVFFFKRSFVDNIGSFPCGSLNRLPIPISHAW
jgi:hypothetical protein